MRQDRFSCALQRTKDEFSLVNSLGELGKKRNPPRDMIRKHVQNAGEYTLLSR